MIKSETKALPSKTDLLKQVERLEKRVERLKRSEKAARFREENLRRLYNEARPYRDIVVELFGWVTAERIDAPIPATIFLGKIRRVLR